jgi:hypothetical protein
MQPVFSIAVIVAGAALLPAAEATLGFDLAGAISLEQRNYTFGIIRGYHSFGAFDTDLVATAANFRAAGLPAVASYMFPCPTKDAAAQVADFLDQIASNKVQLNSLWLDIEQDPSTGCGWSTTDFAANCQFMKDLASALNAKGVKNWGTYSTAWEWSTLFNNQCDDTLWSSRPLWYANPDLAQNFSDYKPFSSWTGQPFMKQYDWNDSPCGVNVDSDWLPGPFTTTEALKEDIYGKPLLW